MTNEPLSERLTAAKRFLLGLVVVTGLLLVLLLRPLWVGLFLAVVLAALLWPLHRRLSARLRGSRSAAAGLLVTGVLVVLVGPTVGFSAFLIREGRSGVAFVVLTIKSDAVTALVKRLPEPLEKLANEALANMPRDEADLQDAVQEQLTENGGSAATAVGSVMSMTGSILFQLGVVLIALFFFLVQGGELMSWLDAASPLLPGQTRELLTEVKHVSSSVVTSTVITAGVQAAAALIGYFIAQVPHPFFFATMTFFTAFIPAIGAGTMCVAAAALLLATGHTGMAIFLAIWGLVVVGLVDNVVKPILIRGGRVPLSGGVVFFSLIGGLAAFGPIGLLLGPLVITFFLSLVRVYRRDFANVPPVTLATSAQG